MTQAQKHFKNFFTKTYNEWSDHVFSYQVIGKYFLGVVKCRPSEMVAFHYKEEKCIKIMDVLFRESKTYETNRSPRQEHSGRTQTRTMFLDAITEHSCFKAVKYVKGGKNTAFESGSGGEWKANGLLEWFAYCLV